MTPPESLRDVPITVVRSVRRKKSITIRVFPSKVEVLVPSRTPTHYIENLLRERATWIQAQWVSVQSRAVDTVWPPTPLYLKGEPTTFVRQPSHHCKTASIRFESGRLILSSPPTLSDEQERTAVVKWYRQLAVQEIPFRVAEWAQKLGYRYEAIRVKDQKSRWGSCSKSGNLNFNWRLIMTPAFVMDYVIVHELCHLRELNHSNRFWRLVEEAFPRYMEAKQWLKTNGASLYF